MFNKLEFIYKLLDYTYEVICRVAWVCHTISLVSKKWEEVWRITSQVFEARVQWRKRYRDIFVTWKSSLKNSSSIEEEDEFEEPDEDLRFLRNWRRREEPIEDLKKEHDEDLKKLKKEHDEERKPWKNTMKSPQNPRKNTMKNPSTKKKGFHGRRTKKNNEEESTRWTQEIKF